MIKKIILGSFLLILMTGCQDKITDVSLKADDNCNNKAELFIEQKDRNIYTYCLRDTKIKVNGQEVDLKNFIENDDNAIDKIIGTLKLEETFYDGGTKLYRGTDLTVIKCNTLDGNRDIYIGDQNMKFKQNFCDNNNYTFVRTYTVKSIKEYTEQQYTEDGTPVGYGNSFEVELQQFQQEPTKVIINNLWNKELVPNKTYEFEFQLYSDAKDIKDTLDYLFKHTTIVEIRETDKVGLEQTQEPMMEK
jgi:hypothetical protein